MGWPAARVLWNLYPNFTGNGIPRFGSAAGENDFEKRLLRKADARAVGKDVRREKGARNAVLLHPLKGKAFYAPLWEVPLPLGRQSG